MTQHEELARVKKKIQSMLNMTTSRGCSEAEASFAMEQVGKLLVQFNLSMDQVTLSDEPLIRMTVGTGTQKRAQNSTYMSALATFCGVKVWFHKVPKKEICYNFYGLESDVQMASYLANMILRAIKTETDTYKATPEYRYADVHRKRLSTSFQNGMCQRIRSRLQEITSKNRAETEAAGTSTELVVIAKDKKVDASFRKLGLKLTVATTWTRSTESSSHRAGSQAGDRVNFNRPINDGDGPKLIGQG